MINESTIRKWWEIFKDGHKLVEVRILGKFQYSGYYKNIDKLIEDIKQYESLPDEQIYFTLNDIEDGCYGRQQCEQLIKSPKQTTSDSNIIRRTWFFVDFDPVRVAGINATDEEFELAHKKAQDVYKYLRNIGFNEPVICRSGNGIHLQYRIDLPNNDEIRELLSQFLQSLGLMFTDPHVDIDESVFNAARICKLYGTVAKKGANLSDRPWRMSEIVYVPDEIKVNDISLFKKVADMLPKEEPKPTNNYQYQNGNNEPFDLEKFLNAHSIRYTKEVTQKWTKYILDHCFFNPEHKHKDAAIVQMSSGAIKYVCYHNSCQHHTWQEMRQALDPDAYAPKPQNQRQPQTQFQPARRQPVPEIKPEIPELGKKWFSMKDITKVNVNDIPHVKTGFTELDRRIKGLFFGSLMVLSGSNSSGKSSWLNTLILNFLQQNEKCALWSGELRPDVLKAWIQMVAAGARRLNKSDHGSYYFVNDMIGTKIDRWMDGKFFLYNNEYSNKWEQIFADMRELVKLGVRIFILDNLFSMDIDIFGGDNNKQQKELVNQITEFCKKEMAIVILVAHPRKTSAFIRKIDISGNSNITDAASYVAIMHRVNQDFRRSVKEVFPNLLFRPDQNSPEFNNMLEIAKDRMMGVQDYFCGMYYEFESRRFKNTMVEQVEYGWRDDIVVQMSFEEPEPIQQPVDEPPASPVDNTIPFSPPDSNDEPPF